jgi:hypothetical protein
MVKRYQREVIRSYTSKKGEQHIGQKIPKGGIIRSHTSKKDEQHIGQKIPKEKGQNDKQRSTKLYTEN